MALFSFFSKSKPSPSNTASEYREECIRNAQAMMSANYLSPTQIGDIIKNNQDIDFLRSEAQNEMNNPDVDFLSERLLPAKIKNIGWASHPMEHVINAVTIGDMIGSTLEFAQHTYSEAATITLPPRRSFHTDDTVLTKATWNAILENPDNPDFRQAYINAYQKEKGAGYGSAFVAWAEGVDVDNTHGYHSYGNGCAMRIAPIAFHYEDISIMVKHTIDSVMVTHNHVESVKAAVVLNICVWMALHGYTKDEIMQYCNEHYGPCTEQLIYASSHLDSTTPLPEVTAKQPVSRASLFANYAVPFAIRCWYETTDYETCMRKILSYYGDTDTICAIAAGLCLAYYGTTGLNVAHLLALDTHKI